MPSKQPEKKLLIYVDRLRDGQAVELEESLPAEVMEVTEEELHFDQPIEVKGEAYLAGQELVVHICLSTTVQMACKICNELAPIEINVPNLYHVEALEKIKTGIISLVPIVREALLLELPLVAECNDGQCPERGLLEHYCAKPKEDEEMVKPFQGLTFDK